MVRRAIHCIRCEREGLQSDGVAGVCSECYPGAASAYDPKPPPAAPFPTGSNMTSDEKTRLNIAALVGFICGLVTGGGLVLIFAVMR